jgi:hypothetical protein
MAIPISRESTLLRRILYSWVGCGSSRPDNLHIKYPRPCSTIMLFTEPISKIPSSSPSGMVWACAVQTPAAKIASRKSFLINQLLHIIGILFLTINSLLPFGGRLTAVAIHIKRDNPARPARGQLNHQTSEFSARQIQHHAVNELP